MSNTDNSCNTPQEIKTHLQGLISKLNLPYFSYLLIRRPNLPSTVLDTVLYTNYPDEWQKRYAQKRYHLEDPVSEISSSSRLAFCWGSDRFLRNFRQSQRRVFHEGREFSIRHGYSIPISGPKGDLGVLSIAGDREIDIKEVVRSESAELQLNAIEIHDYFIRSLNPTSYSTIRLSPRERECLLWTSEGKTADEIADRICLSVSTVNYHLSKSIQKFAASNKHHAAIIAMRHGIL